MNLSSIKANLLNISFWRNGFTPKSSTSCMNAGVRSHNSTVRQVAGDRKPVLQREASSMIFSGKLNQASFINLRFKKEQLK